MKTPVGTTSRSVITAVILFVCSLFSIQARVMDNGIDPANLGKGEWIYVLSTAISQQGSLSGLMTYLKNQKIEYIIVKAGDAGYDYYYPSGNLQFSTSVVNAAHAAGLKIFGYTRSWGTNVQAEIDLAERVYNRGADGFVLDAEAEWEASRLGSEGPMRATNLCAGIKALFPTKFLGHSPFPYISYHSSFPYKEFGYYCDAVMPQDYWNEISLVNCSPTQMVTDMSSQWRNWQNSLTGKWTNAIKPICPAGSAWNSTCDVSGDDIRTFVNALKTDPNPATKGGYHGVNYWREELHTADMWAGIKDADIGTAPVILTQPKAITVTNVNPTNVTFIVDAVGGNPLIYQWRFNGVAIPGATNWSYTLSNVQFTNGGSYSVTITNYLGSSNSANAALTVKAPPKISTQPVSQVVVVSNNATFNVVANGTATLNYQWKLNNTNIPGATGSSYTRGNVAFAHAGNYTVAISNSFGNITSSAANLTVVASSSPPVITTQPQSKTILAGDTLTLTTAASGTGPLLYQWRLNGGNIANATTSTLAITNAQPANAGTYSVIASNAAGFEISSDAVVAVNYALNLTINGGGTVTKSPYAASYPSGTVVTLTAASGFTGWSGSVNGTGTPLSVTMNGNKNITATFSYPNVIIESRQANGALSPSSIYTDSGFLDSTLKSTATPLSGTGSRYASSSSAYFTVYPTLNGPDRSYLVEITHGSASSISADISVTNNVVGGSLSPSSTTAFQKTEAVNVWASVGTLTLNSGTTVPTVKFSPSGGTISSASRFYSDSVRFSYLPLPSILTHPQRQTNAVGSSATFTVETTRATGFQWRWGGTNIPGATSSSYTLGTVLANSGGNYSVRVTGDNGNVTSSNALLTVVVPPSVSTPPQSQTANLGQNVNFSVVAAGTSPLTYQWRFQGENIPGATNSSYTQSNVQSGDIGNYSVVVRNGLGAAVSPDASLAILLPPTITAQPANQTVDPGASATFSVVATGAQSYQWQFDGTNISGAINSSYTVTGANQSKAGFYVAIVSNTAGSTVSDPAELVVNTPPSVTDSPESQTVYVGTTVSFSVAATGTQPFYYQWRFKNNAISGATNSVYMKTNVQTNDSGDYYVDVSNTIGQASSLTATLTVQPQPTIFDTPIIAPDKTIQLGLTGQPGATNILEASTDLSNWLPLITNVNTNGTMQYIDGATNGILRFYRTRQAP